MEKKILLVDDSKPMLILLSGLFKSKKYQVESKTNAIAALESLALGELPDLIITDINMPEMDGYEFVMKLKDSELYSHIPVMVLSGNQSSADRLRSFKMGVDEYLVKPFNPEELFIRAEKLMSSVSKYALI